MLGGNLGHKSPEAIAFGPNLGAHMLLDVFLVLGPALLEGSGQRRAVGLPVLVAGVVAGACPVRSSINPGEIQGGGRHVGKRLDQVVHIARSDGRFAALSYGQRPGTRCPVGTCQTLLVVARIFEKAAGQASAGPSPLGKVAQSRLGQAAAQAAGAGANLG